MEGYDTALLSSFYAYPSWLKKYGKLRKNGKYTISAAWQSGLSNVGHLLSVFFTNVPSQRCPNCLLLQGGSVGSILGLLISAPISERIGCEFMYFFVFRKVSFVLITRLITFFWLLQIARLCSSIWPS